MEAQSSNALPLLLPPLRARPQFPSLHRPTAADVRPVEDYVQVHAVTRGEIRQVGRRHVMGKVEEREGRQEALMTGRIVRRRRR